MSDTMYRASVPVFTHQLRNLAAILRTAARDAKARGIDPEVLLNARLAPDMLPLIRQVQIATDHAKGCSARLAGVEPPVFKDDESSFSDLDQRIRAALAFIRGLKASQFADSATRPITMGLPFGEIRFDGLNYLHGWALPNFYFHYTTTYNILRHNGLAIGKLDFLGRVPGMQMDARAARKLGVKPRSKSRKK